MFNQGFAGSTGVGGTAVDARGKCVTSLRKNTQGTCQCAVGHLQEEAQRVPAGRAAWGLEVGRPLDPGRRTDFGGVGWDVHYLGVQR